MICICPRRPLDHRATVKLAVYPVLPTGEIGQEPVDDLSMPVCGGVVTAYRSAIRDGLLAARIDVSDL